MLDWSANPLVAAFFAVIDDYESDGAIYAHYTKFTIDEARHQPFSSKVKKIMRYRPRAVSRRIINQFGYFTYHVNPAREMSPHNTYGEIEKIIIPARIKEETVFMLNQFGINFLTIYPDLEGSSRQLAWHTALTVGFGAAGLKILNFFPLLKQRLQLVDILFDFSCFLERHIVFDSRSVAQHFGGNETLKSVTVYGWILDKHMVPFLNEENISTGKDQRVGYNYKLR